MGLKQKNINKIKKVMNLKEMTYRDVVEATGINLKTLHEILHGKGNPRPITLHKLEDGLGFKHGALR